MRLLIHLTNILFLWSIPLIFTFLLSLAFPFKYGDAIVSSTFIVLYTFFGIVITIAYLILNEEDSQSLKLIHV